MTRPFSKRNTGNACWQWAHPVKLLTLAGAEARAVVLDEAWPSEAFLYLRLIVSHHPLINKPTYSYHTTVQVTAASRIAQSLLSISHIYIHTP